MRVLSLSLPLALALAGHANALPGSVKRAQDEQASQRAAAVKEAFQTGWNGYKQYAFPHDQLHPLDNTYDDNLYVFPGT
jgi:mannosyl-oligosaccharide alpha-1,2-mannosidase